MLERHGNFVLASLVSESLSEGLRQGSVLPTINSQPTMLMGFDSVVKALSQWITPLKLTFLTSPRHMGWLNLVIKGKQGWLKMTGQKCKASDDTVCDELRLPLQSNLYNTDWYIFSHVLISKCIAEKVYATLSLEVVILFIVKRDGKSTKQAFSVNGSAVGLVESTAVLNGKILPLCSRWH